MLARKLKALKVDLKSLNKEEFGHVRNEQKQLLEQLQILEDREFVEDLSEVDLETKKGLVAVLEELFLMEKIS